jgi:uncharacterized membrane protein
MNRGFGFFKRTLISGLLFLLPIVILLVVAKKAIEILAHMLRPVARVVPADRVVGLAIADMLAIVLLLSIGFAAGLIAQTAVGTYLNVRLERALLRKMPGYTLLKGMAHSAGGVEHHRDDPVVALARIDEAWLLAFIVEEHGNGLLTVFIPSAPTPTAGSVYYLTESQVHRLDVPFGAAVTAVMQLGVGSKEMLRNVSLPQA